MVLVQHHAVEADPVRVLQLVEISVVQLSTELGIKVGV